MRRFMASQFLQTHSIAMSSDFVEMMSEFTQRVINFATPFTRVSLVPLQYGKLYFNELVLNIYEMFRNIFEMCVDFINMSRPKLNQHCLHTVDGSRTLISISCEFPET